MKKANRTINFMPEGDQQSTFCQNPTLTQLSSKQLGLGLDTIVTWDTYISHGTSSYKPWNMHPKL